MTHRLSLKSFALLAAAVTLTACAVPATAPQKPAGGSRTTLQHVAYPAGYEVNVIRIVLPANANSPHHTHPGLESGYVARGSVTIAIDGQPEHVLHAGDTFETPAYAPHIVKNGPQETEIVSTYITEVGKPLSQSIP